VRLFAALRVRHPAAGRSLAAGATRGLRGRPWSFLVELSDAAAREAEESRLPCVWVNLNRRAPGGAIVYDGSRLHAPSRGALGPRAGADVSLWPVRRNGWHYFRASPPRRGSEGVALAGGWRGRPSLTFGAEGSRPRLAAPRVCAEFANCLRKHPNVDGLVLYGDRMAPAAYAGAALAGRWRAGRPASVGVNDRSSPWLCAHAHLDAAAPRRSRTAAVEMILAS